MTDERGPCGNDDCDKCYPLPRWKVSVERVARVFNEREFKAATPEEALAEYEKGTTWPASYDDRRESILEEHAPVVTLVVDDDEERRLRHLEMFCYHNLPKLPDVALSQELVDAVIDDEEKLVHPKVEEAFQQIDAALYNGDTFDKPDNRKKLKEYAQAWLRRIEEDERHEQQNQSSPEENQEDGDRA